MRISVHACIIFDSTLNNLAVKRNGNIQVDQPRKSLTNFTLMCKYYSILGTLCYQV